MRLRRLVAPTGSFRHRFLRHLYIPAIRYLDLLDRKLEAGPRELTRVVPVRTLAERSKTWPRQPRVLILKVDHLGDFIVALPAMQRIRRAFPEAVVTLVCAPWNRELAERSNFFDRVIGFEFFAATKAAFRGLTGDHLDRFCALELGEFDVAIDLRHDPDTRPLLALVNAASKAGFAAPVAAGGACMDISLPDMEHIAVADGSGRPVDAQLRLNLLAAAVIDSFAPQPHPTSSLVQQPTMRLPSKPFAILAPGAGSPIRIWPVDRLAKVGQALIDEYDLDVLLLGSPAQAEDCARIANTLPKGRVHDLAGQSSISDLPSIIARATILVGYDSGLSHIAASLGLPTVVVMGSIGNSDVWHVEGARAVALTTKISCQSCYLDRPEQCPIEVRCLTEITVDMVMDSCGALIAKDVSKDMTKEDTPRSAWIGLRAVEPIEPDLKRASSMR